MAITTEGAYRPSAACAEPVGPSLVRTPATNRLSNHWITLHQDGHPAGYKPLLVPAPGRAAQVVFVERSASLEAHHANIESSGGLHAGQDE